MRFASLRSLPALAVTLLLAACGGGDGGGGTEPPPTPVPTTVNITSGVISLDQIGATSTVTATVLDQDGALLPGASLNFSSNNTSVATVSPAGVVTATGDGTATITVSSGSASATTAANVTVAVLGSGQPVTNLSGAAGSVRQFTIDVAPGAGAGKVLEFGTTGGTGDADIFVRFGAAPAGSTFDCASVLDANGEACAISNPQAGTWFVTVQGFSEGPGFNGVTLLARLVDVAPVTLGSNVTGLSGQADELLYFSFDVPAPSAGPDASEAQSREADGPGGLILGTKPIDGVTMGELRRELDELETTEGPQPNTPPTLDIAISGGTGDADLIATAGTTVSRTPPESIECYPFAIGSEESCSIPNPTPGAWIAAVAGFEQFAGLSLSIGYDAGGGGGPTSGTLTIQKEVQSSTGGAADNPASPSLSGFEFEVRPAGGGAVVATVTTDASGSAQATLAPGSYDVTESNAQGLTDFTAAANGVAVPEGGNVDVAWVNRQSAPVVGNQAPLAVINASPTSVPAGDNNATSVRLYAGNSSDPDGDLIFYQWSTTGGTFVGPTNQQFARMTFPGGTTQTVTLTVNDGQDQDVAQVQVTGAGALPPVGTFNIELVPIEPITDPDAQAAFALAKATWERIIRTELPDIPLAATTYTDCFGETGTDSTDPVDDVRIYIKFAPDDGQGGTLASAGPCFIRTSPSVTPIVGLMTFDSDDFGSLSAEAINRVILHEMAHVLGFGTLWNFGSNNLLENPSCPGQSCEAEDPPGPDSRFVGAAAAEDYRSLGGGATSTVPVENAQGGAGTRDGHWRESVFQRELMTGFLTNGVTNPLSSLTIASLRDLGYVQLDFSEADDYSLPGSAPVGGLFDAEVIHLGDDIIRGPIWALDADGKVFLWRSGR